MEALSEIPKESLFFGSIISTYPQSLDSSLSETEFRDNHFVTNQDYSGITIPEDDNIDIDLDVLLNQDFVTEDTHVIDIAESSVTPESFENYEEDNDSDSTQTPQLMTKMFPDARYTTKNVLPFTVKDIQRMPIKYNFSKPNLNNEDIMVGRPGDRVRLSEEEKTLLLKEGYRIPTHFPLTKMEERALKNIRRKIRNKISAKNSRNKKATYVVGLEKRISLCTLENNNLRKKLIESEKDRYNLHKQVINLQKQLSKFLSHNSVSTTSLMLLFFTFLFIITPIFDPRKLTSLIQNDATNAPNKEIVPGRSRFLMQESELAQNIGNPYLVTVRSAGPPWQQPPKSPNVELKPIKVESTIKENDGINKTDELMGNVGKYKPKKAANDSALTKVQAEDVSKTDF